MRKEGHLTIFTTISAGPLYDDPEILNGYAFSFAGDAGDRTAFTFAARREILREALLPGITPLEAARSRMEVAS